jgi:hypothetical protein
MNRWILNLVVALVGVAVVLLGVGYRTTNCLTVRSGSEVVRQTCETDTSKQVVAASLSLLEAGLILFGFRKNAVGLRQRLSV